ncbi:MAG: hypothetical protein IH591_17950, partial [Bacteroidales bacterium]|nr:hypothetical protein [Bacteroidales bacterium]
MSRIAHIGLTIFTVFLITFLPIFGGPLHFEPQKLKQPDGGILRCYASGDEFYNWLHDTLGYTIVQHPETGFYVYADYSDGNLIPTKLIPGKDDPVESGLEKWLRHSGRYLSEIVSKAEADLLPDIDTKAAPTVGVINNIVVFIRFSDESEFTDHTSVYDDILN